jgi:hypothetical protein
VVNHFTFFYVADRRRIFLLGLAETQSLFGPRPIGQHGGSQLLELFDGHRFGLIGGGPFFDRFVHHISDLVQTFAHFRPRGKTRVKRLVVFGRFAQFMVH